MTHWVREWLTTAATVEALSGSPSRTGFWDPLVKIRAQAPKRRLPDGIRSLWTSSKRRGTSGLAEVN